jgi:hypothetical protein
MHYTGKDVKLGTPNRPIFWVKSPRTGKYEVLYADMTVKEVEPKDAPKALPADSSAKP